MVVTLAVLVVVVGHVDEYVLMDAKTLALEHALVHVKDIVKVHVKEGAVA
mgnify:FL=1